MSSKIIGPEIKSVSTRPETNFAFYCSLNSVSLVELLKRGRGERLRQQSPDDPAARRLMRVKPRDIYHVMKASLLSTVRSFVR
jgi:hypothetical protein